MQLEKESISAFDIIKVGIGPSSSHTMGPWEAARAFCQYLNNNNFTDKVDKVEVHLYGSLAKTGVGHGTDFAVALGLNDYDYRVDDTAFLHKKYEEILNSGEIHLAKMKVIPFRNAIIFRKDMTLEEHPNAMTIRVWLNDGKDYEKTYFSIGGGFFQEKGIMTVIEKRKSSKYPCHYGVDLLRYTEELKMSVSDLVMLNEQSWMTKDEIVAQSHLIFEEIKNAIWRGLNTDGILPGGLEVVRRANTIYKTLTKGHSFEDVNDLVKHLQTIPRDFTKVNLWVSIFALATNEENAAFGRIVTAPTNGSSGVLPAVIMYMMCFLDIDDDEKIIDFLLTAGEIGTYFKKSATISAAMGGCQAEIGVSSSMAAGALTEVRGGTPKQVLMAAEIAMEHHLGLTCDPVGGLVQIPCIERNAMGAIKAITASNLALESTEESSRVSFDIVVETMWETAIDMSVKYKETSEGGLAANIPVNLAEC